MDSTADTAETTAAPSLHLLPVPDAAHHPTAIWDTGTPLLIPLGAGLVTGIRERGPRGDRDLTTDDLVTRDTTVGELWADAALTMLATLGRLTAVHGTALRRRRVHPGIHEVGVLEDAFPAAGLVAHPLLVRPTVRILRGSPRVAVTADGRLLLPDPGVPVPETLTGDGPCSPVLELTDSALLR